MTDTHQILGSIPRSNPWSTQNAQVVKSPQTKVHTGRRRYTTATLTAATWKYLTMEESHTIWVVVQTPTRQFHSRMGSTFFPGTWPPEVMTTGPTLGETVSIGA